MTFQIFISSLNWRQILTVFVFLFNFTTVEGQKINSYKYVYKFQLNKPNDISNITVDTVQNQDVLKTINGKIINYKLEPLTFLTIILRSKDTIIYKTTNDKGLFEITVKPSTYELTISGVNYVSITQTLVINNKINYSLRIKLARHASLNWYDIHSKKKLKKEDIDRIKKCVEVNKSKPINCGKNNTYYVTVEI